MLTTFMGTIGNYNSFPNYIVGNLNSLDDIYLFYINEYAKLIKEWHALVLPDDGAIPFDWSTKTGQYLELQTKIAMLQNNYLCQLEQFIMFGLKWEHAFKIPINSMVAFTIPGNKYPVTLHVQHTEDKELIYIDGSAYVELPVGGLPKDTVITFFSIDAQTYVQCNLNSYVVGTN